MPNPSALIAGHFPLWKRGTKGDLRSLVDTQVLKIPVDLPFPKEVEHRNLLPSEYREFQQTARLRIGPVSFAKQVFDVSQI